MLQSNEALYRTNDPILIDPHMGSPFLAVLCQLSPPNSGWLYGVPF